MTKRFAVQKGAVIPALVVVLMAAVTSFAGMDGEDTGLTDKADSTGQAQEVDGSEAKVSTVVGVPARFTVRDDDLPMPIVRLVKHDGPVRDVGTSPIGMIAGALAGVVVISAAGAIWYSVRRRRHSFPGKKKEKPEVSAEIETPDFEKRQSEAPRLVKPASDTPLGRALVLREERETHAVRIDRLMKKLLKTRAMGY